MFKNFKTTNTKKSDIIICRYMYSQHLYIFLLTSVIFPAYTRTLYIIEINSNSSPTAMVNELNATNHLKIKNSTVNEWRLLIVCSSFYSGRFVGICRPAQFTFYSVRFCGRTHKKIRKKREKLKCTLQFLRVGWHLILHATTARPCGICCIFG